MLRVSTHTVRRAGHMSELRTSTGDELRFRNNFFMIGCIGNLLLFAALIVLCVVFFIAIARNLDSGPPVADESAIQRVLNDQAAAWNRGDLDGFMNGYWRDEKLTFTSGDHVEQ